MNVLENNVIFVWRSRKLKMKFVSTSPVNVNTVINALKNSNKNVSNTWEVKT